MSLILEPLALAGLSCRPAGESVTPPTENLLLWTEEFQRAQWGPINASVSADAANDPDGALTADEITNTGPTGLISQTSATAVSSGTAVSEDLDVSASWARFFVVGTFDSTSYCFSVHLRAAGPTALRLTIDRSGGFIRCVIRDIGNEATYYAWGAQLEQSSSPTGYVKREGS